MGRRGVRRTQAVVLKTALVYAAKGGKALAKPHVRE